MPPINYVVSEPLVVRQTFRQILDRAASENRLPLVLRAAKYMMDELAYDPIRFGESRGFRKASEIAVRFATSPPLSVLFGVHEPSKQVFIFRITLR